MIFFVPFLLLRRVFLPKRENKCLRCEWFFYAFCQLFSSLCLRFWAFWKKKKWDKNTNCLWVMKPSFSPWNPSCSSFVKGLILQEQQIQLKWVLNSLDSLNASSLSFWNHYLAIMLQHFVRVSDDFFRDREKGLKGREKKRGEGIKPRLKESREKRNEYLRSEANRISSVPSVGCWTRKDKEKELVRRKELLTKQSRRMLKNEDLPQRRRIWFHFVQNEFFTTWLWPH